jgi:hypothetical protein
MSGGRGRAGAGLVASWRAWWHGGGRPWRQRCVEPHQAGREVRGARAQCEAGSGSGRAAQGSHYALCVLLTWRASRSMTAAFSLSRRKATISAAVALILAQGHEVGYQAGRGYTIPAAPRGSVTETRPASVRPTKEPTGVRARARRAVVARHRMGKGASSVRACCAPLPESATRAGGSVAAPGMAFHARLPHASVTILTANWPTCWRSVRKQPYNLSHTQRVLLVVGALHPCVALRALARGISWSHLSSAVFTPVAWLLLQRTQHIAAAVGQS